MMNRRHFIKQTALGIGAGVTVLQSSSSVFGQSANNKVNLGVIGCGGRGTQLLGDFLKRGDINVLHCCDPFLDRAERAGKMAEDSPLGQRPKVGQDLRTVLDDPAVDAVICATPDHWHALGCIWACQAGKDVYTEKPASHSPWEGQKMVEAARKYKRIVQHGTQCRSAPYCMAAREYIASGKLGAVHSCKVFNTKGMGNPQWSPETDPPANFDWDKWNGPASEKKYTPAYLGAWHDLYEYSSGDMINDGVHQTDLARMVLGRELPNSVYTYGFRNDASGMAEAPEVFTSLCDYGDMLMTLEFSSSTPYLLKIDPEVRESDMFPLWQQCATRIEIYGTNGMMMLGRHGGGWQVFLRPQSRQPRVADALHGRFPDPEHKENFLACIRSRALPSADIEQGHRSTLLIQYAIISHRVGGQKLRIHPQDETILDNPEAMKLFKREYRKPYEVPDNV
ncbi:MAG: Gfo/Idh/MocA family oxidoreductase [Planctomycetaceae bacterium]|nr:Gfo/Idh/MocA family oxidoreductase [Planctomycetaceae bacterium]